MNTFIAFLAFSFVNTQLDVNNRYCVIEAYQSVCNGTTKACPPCWVLRTHGVPHWDCFSKNLDGNCPKFLDSKDGKEINTSGKTCKLFGNPANVCDSTKNTCPRCWRIDDNGDYSCYNEDSFVCRQPFLADQ